MIEQPQLDSQRDAQELVDERIQRDLEQGFVGTSSDPTPRSHYTIAGVLAGLPVPPTHPPHVTLQ